MQNLEFKLIVPLWGGSEYIELNQLLKLVGQCPTRGQCDSGGAGKVLVAEGAVSVDGKAPQGDNVELRKTRKVRAGSVVTLGDVRITVKAA